MGASWQWFSLANACSFFSQFSFERTGCPKQFRVEQRAPSKRSNALGPFGPLHCTLILAHIYFHSRPDKSVTPHLCLPLKPGNLREHCQGWCWDVLPDPPIGNGGKGKGSLSENDDEAPCVLLNFFFPRMFFFL